MKRIGLLLIALTMSSCSTRQVVQVALSKDPEKAVRNMAQRRVEAYKYNPELALSDMKRAKTEFDHLLLRLQKESGAKWGSKEAAVLSSRTRYVKYTQNYKNRVVVDYDTGSILIEHLDEEQVRDKLRAAIVVALLTPDDPGAVDLFSDKEVDLSGKPYLQEMVADEHGTLLKTRADVENYADFLVANRLKSRTIEVDGAGKQVSYVQFNMMNAYADKRALQYAGAVRKYAETAQVSRSLVYAIIKIESSFNPYAISAAPAYGMMQLVPGSGGREAYRKAKGEDVVPSREYLFNAENNIELGATYLGLLMKDSPLQYIDNPVSREYCAIAAYNTGPGNVFRAFSGASGKARQTEAIDRINALRPDEVFETLRTRLPYEETRSYIVNAVSMKKRYATL